MTSMQTLLKPPPKQPSSPAAPARKGTAVSEESVIISFRRLKKRVVLQTWIIASLAVLLLLLLPFAKPVDMFFALTPERKVKLISGLTMPNLTDRAVLSWATTSITEVMTMGFGDMDVRLPKQRNRFTEKGWAAYMESFETLKVRESFKQNQLVLTTVPSNTPVVVGRGINPENIYQWNVEMPIIMNYATNNNVTRRQRATVALSIVRVPIEENSFGIAIRNWRLQ